jgi:FixJ family two-component response regulator
MSAEEPVVFIVDEDRSVCEALERLLATVGLKAQTFGQRRNS